MFSKSWKCPSVIIAGLLLSMTLSFYSGLNAAGSSPAPYYSPTADNLFWFIQTSDTHIGASGSQDTTNLQWLVNQARQIINPNFIIVTGDLTDSTNGNIFNYPNGPYQAEWDQYKSIVDGTGIPVNTWRNFYFDIPGNHDAYNDANFVYYRANSVQGRATSGTQASFTRQFAFGIYHFIGINTADNTGDPFSFFSPYGDHAGLDAGELSFIAQEMNLHQDSKLTMVFGHHPLRPTGNSQDTYVYYGRDEFASLMDANFASLYGYGHTHAYSETIYTQPVYAENGFFYFNVASLGKSASGQYTIIAIDGDGISSKISSVGSWPAVLITAPLNLNLGASGSYGYRVPAEAANPIRALVFDPKTPTSVTYQINGGTQLPMTRLAPDSPIWQGMWDASALAAGNYSIRVQASSLSGSSSNTISVNVTNPAPVVYSAASFTGTGSYVTSGTRKNKTTIFELRLNNTFTQGEGVVFRLAITDSSMKPIPNATAQFTITGPNGFSLPMSTGPSNSAGTAEVTWTTSAPNKRGSGGTTIGTYTATLTGLTASGYTWNGVRPSISVAISTK